MGNKKLHPSVEEFKNFVKNNPKILQEARSQKVTLQELYEDWTLLGEEDPRWDVFRLEAREKKAEEPEKKGDFLSQVMGVVKNMDPGQIEGHIYNLNQALSVIQGVISQFKGGSPSNNQMKAEHPSHPFLFRKD